MMTILAQFGETVQLGVLGVKIPPQPWHLLLVPVILLGWALLIWYIVTRRSV